MSGFQFIVGMAFAVILAAIFPSIGSSDSILPISLITSLGVACIFFFYGLKLKTQEIVSGLSNWKLHLLTQSITFLLFPFLLLFIYPFIPEAYRENTWLGFYFLAALPSTVSSSVVMVSIARGNVPAAIFNASLSGILGILLTPLWMGLFVTPEMGFEYSNIYKRLFLEIILPLCAGLLLNKWGNNWATQNKKKLTVFDQLVILWIVFSSFADAFYKNIFVNFTYEWIMIHFLFVVILFTLVYYTSALLCKKLKFSREDSITAIYCGTKKSLTHGSVFGQAMFPNPALLVNILFPIMLYHALQILFMSVLANKEKEKSQDLN